MEEVTVSRMFWPHLVIAELFVFAPLAAVNGVLGALAFLVVLGTIEIAYGLFSDWFFGID